MTDNIYIGGALAVAVLLLFLGSLSGAAILGGLSVSTMFTLVMIPALFSLWVDFLEWWRPGQTAAAVQAFAEMSGLQEGGGNGAAPQGPNGAPAGSQAHAEAGRKQV
ncbi:MAG: hypothetical protein AAB502_02640 [Chloroflexota bacterium]